MSYKEAMQAAGAKILEFQEFGSYQGDWWSLVEFQDKRGWVTGSFGSCSGCDAFEAEFGYVEEEDKERFAYFGSRYLDPILSQDQALKESSANLDWDYDAKDMVKFIEEMGIKYGI